MITSEIKNIKESPEDLKKFGTTMGIVLILISVYFFYKGKDSAYWLAVIGSLFFIIGMISPGMLRPINKLWMSLAVLMGWVMTRVILSVLFFIVLTPISWIAKISGKKFLDLERNKNKKSYWDKRKEPGFSPENYEKQF